MLSSYTHWAPDKSWVICRWMLKCYRFSRIFFIINYHHHRGFFSCSYSCFLNFHIQKLPPEWNEVENLAHMQWNKILDRILLDLAAHWPRRDPALDFLKYFIFLKVTFSACTGAVCNARIYVIYNVLTTAQKGAETISNSLCKHYSEKYTDLVQQSGSASRS